MSTEFELKLISAGYGNMVVASRIVAVLVPGSSPIKRLREGAKDNHKLIDATQGKRTRAIIVLDSGHVILSAIKYQTLAARIDKARGVQERKRKISDQE